MLNDPETLKCYYNELLQHWDDGVVRRYFFNSEDEAKEYFAEMEEEIYITYLSIIKFENYLECDLKYKMGIANVLHRDFLRLLGKKLYGNRELTEREQKQYDTIIDMCEKANIPLVLQVPIPHKLNEYATALTDNDKVNMSIRWLQNDLMCYKKLEDASRKSIYLGNIWKRVKEVCEGESLGEQ